MQNTTLEDIKNKAFPVLNNAGVLKATLFGSYVRGDNTEKSDIDILISFPENTTLIDFIRLKRDLEEKLHNKVDIVSYNAVSPLIRDSVFKHQYPIL